MISFEKSVPDRTEAPGCHEGLAQDSGDGNDTALLIPCYKSEQLIGNTLEAALKIFPPNAIFVCIQLMGNAILHADRSL